MRTPLTGVVGHAWAENPSLPEREGAPDQSADPTTNNYRPPAVVPPHGTSAPAPVSSRQELCVSGFEEVAAGRRRHEAARRLLALESGRSDPWRYPAPGVDGYDDAAQHLLSLGLTPAPNHEALRAMWRRGGRSRRAAELVSERWDLEAAS